jgi:hypothetical protein
MAFPGDKSVDSPTVVRASIRVSLSNAVMISPASPCGGDPDQDGQPPVELKAISFNPRKAA